MIGLQNCCTKGYLDFISGFVRLPSHIPYAASVPSGWALPQRWGCSPASGCLLQAFCAAAASLSSFADFANSDFQFNSFFLTGSIAEMKLQNFPFICMCFSSFLFNGYLPAGAGGTGESFQEPSSHNWGA